MQVKDGGEGIGSPRQHWPRTGYQILFVILHFPSDPFRLEWENIARCGIVAFRFFIDPKM